MAGRATRDDAPRDRNEHGFTLIELLISIVILPLVIGGVAIALVTVLSLQGGVASRISDSADAQTVSANLDQDVQSATFLTTSATATQCGSPATQTQLLGLEWSLNALSGAYQNVVSYVTVQSGSRHLLLRLYCASGVSNTPTLTSTVSSDIAAGQIPPTVAPSTSNTSAAAGWTSAQPVTGVTFAITEPGSNYPYTLVGLPDASVSNNPAATFSPPPTSCGFSTPGTGLYASSLCFVNLSSYSASLAAAPACQTITSGVVNTLFTISFCLSVTTTTTAPAGVVTAAAIPTWLSPPSASESGAFLGNNGFYTGIQGDPALYQTTGSTTANPQVTTLNITSIQVADANGDAASTWTLVTGDAESTDDSTGTPAESITWTTCPSVHTACAVSAASPILNLLPNSLTSPYGNACGGTTFLSSLLTGVGSNLVKCAPTVASVKTGTVMLEAVTPTTLTINMVGSQAVFIGLIVP